MCQSYFGKNYNIKSLSFLCQMMDPTHLGLNWLKCQWTSANARQLTFDENKMLYLKDLSVSQFVEGFNAYVTYVEEFV